MSTSPPLATKAPEHDAQEPPSTSSLSPHDSSAQSVGMTEHCTTDRPLPPSTTTATPTGELTKFSDIDVYISKPADYPHSPSRLLLLLSSGTGVKSINNQLQADRFASEGFVVVMPDQFGGDPAPNTTAAAAAAAATADRAGSSSSNQDGHLSIIEQVKLRAAETAKSFMLDMWLARHTPEKVLPILHTVLESARDEFADSVANAEGVYAAGYCFGGKYVLMLAAGHPHPLLSERSEEGKDEEEAGGNVASGGPLIKAGVIAHATLVTRDDLTAVKAPVSLVCVGTSTAICYHHQSLSSLGGNPYNRHDSVINQVEQNPENDPVFPDDILEAGRTHLQAQNIDHEIRTYPAVPHGFAVVGEYEDPHIQKAQTAAFDQLLAWLKNH